MTQGVIAEWCVKEGESIKANSVMMKVETDKATVDFEATDESVLGKILVPGGEVTVGRVIALLVEDAAAAAAFRSLSVEAISKELGLDKPPAAAGPSISSSSAPPPPPPVAPAPVAKAAPAPPAAAPKAAAAPAPAPAPAPAAAGGDGYAAWPAWGISLSRTPMGKALALQQEAYEALYGFSGVALVEKQEPAPKAKK
jgi:pyruvate dehydrogenase E2 component (dihydrolipoamide acetyltransferase)